MKINFSKVNNTLIAELISDNIEINDTQDALDLMANSTYNEANKIIVHEKNITPEFFDLKTGLAGEILQKFSNYKVQLAIIGDFSKYESKSLRDFIYESNKSGRIIFVNSVEEARERWEK